MTPALLAIAEAVQGFLPAEEAAALHAAGLRAPAGTWLEVGSYCGRSTVHLGDAARRAGAQLVTLDHHRGSEENQPGWEWHDPSLVDPHTGRLETLPSLRRTLWDAGLDEVVSVVVGTTHQVARWWATPLTLLFLDGNHTEAVAQHDYSAFAQHVVPGGTLLIHDVFERPEDGGRPPWNVFCRARDEGFTEVGQQGSLRWLTRSSRTVTPQVQASRMTELDVLETGYAATLHAVEELSPGDLTRPTPCPEWDVRALLAHIHATTDGLVEVLHGREGDWERDSLGDDPADTLRRSFADALEAWSAPGALAVPSRQMPGMRVVDFALGDAVAHAWDLSVALGRPFAVPDEQAALVLARWGGEPAAQGRQYGVFGPLVAVPEDAPAFDRLLGQVGRDPAQSASAAPATDQA